MFLLSFPISQRDCLPVPNREFYSRRSQRTRVVELHTVRLLNGGLAHCARSRYVGGLLVLTAKVGPVHSLQRMGNVARNLYAGSLSLAGLPVVRNACGMSVANDGHPGRFPLYSSLIRGYTHIYDALAPASGSESRTCHSASGMQPDRR
jgi:hypothetical protein